MGIFCLLVSLLSAFSHPAFAVKNINLTSGEWPPYLSIDLAKGGIAAQIVSEAFAQQGIKTYYGYYPWKRSFEYARRGFGAANFRWHGSLAWIETEQRKQHFWFSEPIVSDKEILFSLKSNPIHWQTIEDLRGISIGGTVAAVYPTLEKTAEKELISLEIAGDYQSLFKRLLYQRIDAIALTKTVALHYMTNHLSEAETQQITYSETLVEQRHFRLMLSKKHSENQHYLQQFNQGLQKLKTSGRYAELLEQLESRLDSPLN
ncbi:substrate-binding periplasmic protein [Agarivorans aestuarii]|uniref:substrate-binding periplasmic protein n=1 Tax=Agarivorans aestuarii TaxID=1563703 RepID=UPI001C81B531|nr:transporter substrate-binding domain-containing protein [Agarivorans aestuarii]